jgi:hypothetical protein
MKIGIAIIIALLLWGAAWFFWLSDSPDIPEETSGEVEQEQTSVPTLPEIEPESNPVEDEIPDLNPTESTNPFEGAYSNPFK